MNRRGLLGWLAGIMALTPAMREIMADERFPTPIEPTLPLFEQRGPVFPPPQTSAPAPVFDLITAKVPVRYVHRIWTGTTWAALDSREGAEIMDRRHNERFA